MNYEIIGFKFKKYCSRSILGELFDYEMNPNTIFGFITIFFFCSLKNLCDFINNGVCKIL